MSRRIKFESLTPAQLKTVLGEYNNHMKYIQERLDIKISQRQGDFCLSGDILGVERGERIIYKLVDEAQNTKDISAEELHLIIQSSISRDEDIAADEELDDEEDADNLDAASDFTPVSLRTRNGKIIPRGGNQQRYVRDILSSDVSFGIGPAGTGKTYLAVACAVDMLERNEIERILLVRPAVEAGEKLGFLPGDLTQKIDPYLRPLYDALYEMLGFDKVGKMLEKQISSIFVYEIRYYLLARAALTVKLFLPLALLAARTLLPFGVDILSLKPCLFLFFLSDGWNVLLLITYIFKSVIFSIFSGCKDS